MDTTANNLRAVRAGKRISQARLADLMREAGATHWHQNTVSRIESGAQPLTASDALLLSSILGAEVEAGAGDWVLPLDAATAVVREEIATVRGALMEALAKLDQMQARLDKQEN